MQNVKKMNNIGKIPKYLEIAGGIKESIREGIFCKGDILPPETAYAAEYGVTRVTVRNAMKVLENEKLISPVQARKRKVLINWREVDSPKFIGCIGYELEGQNTFSNTMYLRIFNSMVGEFQHKNTALIKITVNPKTPNAVPSILRNYQFDAYLLLGNINSQFIKKTSAPIFSLDYFYNSKADYTIFYDGRELATEAIRYLYNQGHREIALFNFETEYSYPLFDDIRIGYERNLKIINPGQKRARVFTMKWNHFNDNVKTEKFISGMLEKYPQMDALIFSTSNIGVPIMNIFQKLGVRIPEQFSTVALGGYGDANSCIPSLTVFENDVRRQAEFFAEYVSGVLAGEEKCPKVCINYFKLVERKSVKSR